MGIFASRCAVAEKRRRIVERRQARHLDDNAVAVIGGLAAVAEDGEGSQHCGGNEEKPFESTKGTGSSPSAVAGAKEDDQDDGKRDEAGKPEEA